MALPLKAPDMSDKDLRRAISINPVAIQQEYVELPSMISTAINRKVTAAKVYRIAELEAEIAEEQLLIDTRAANEAAVDQTSKGEGKVKRATVDEIRALVVTNPVYRKIRERVIEAEEERDRAGAFVEAMRAKSSMLVSLGADVRAEREGDISIKDRSARR